MQPSIFFTYVNASIFLKKVLTTRSAQIRVLTGLSYIKGNAKIVRGFELMASMLSLHLLRIW